MKIIKGKKDLEYKCIEKQKNIKRKLYKLTI